MTQVANIREILVRRRRSGGTDTMKVNLWQLLNTGENAQDIRLQDGDTIYIPTATNLNDRETTQLALASFSPDKVAIASVLIRKVITLPL